MRTALATLATVVALASAIDPPTQMRLAYAGAVSGSGMSVSWSTVNPTTTSTVRFGPTPALGTNVTGYQVTYNVTWHHHVVLTGLTPSTQYYYICGDDTAGWSTLLSFTTAAAAGSEFPLNLAVFGDMSLYNSNATFLDLARIYPNITFLWHVGDVSYADDGFLHDPFTDNYDTTWDAYLTKMQPYVQSKPYMVIPGNHEAECHSPVCFLDNTVRERYANFSAYNHRFRMPSPESSGTMNMWYSFNYGSIHFVQIDTETDYPGAPNDDYSSKNGNFGNQMAWLEADLAAAAAARASGQVTWILATGHRPVYSRLSADASGNPTGSAAALQTAVEGLFNKYGVDVFFCGHEHSVEASWPVFNNQVVQSYDNPPYTTYVVTGAAGCDEGHSDYSGAPATSWNRYTNGADYGLSTLYIQDANTLTWTFRRGTDGATLDTFTLTRKH